MWADGFEQRTRGLIAITVVVFLALFCRLIYLQIIQGSEFSRSAEQSRIRLIPSLAPRGEILDRHGQRIVTSRRAFTVELTRPVSRIPDEVLRRLGGLLGLSVDDIHKRIAKADLGSAYNPVIIQTDISTEARTVIAEQPELFPGVQVQVQSVREYPFRQLAANIFGYVGEITPDQISRRATQGYEYNPGDIVGQDGLEYVLDPYLRGENGGRQIEINAAGRAVRDIGFRPAQRGSNAILTLDLDVQKAAEKALRDQIAWIQKQPGGGSAHSGAAIAVDVNTGAILAMTSLPSFDPGVFVRKDTPQSVAQVLLDPGHPLYNRAIAGVYAPGSIFKMVTMTTALETGKAAPADWWHCPGYYDVPGVRLHCWQKNGHGDIDLLDGMAQSCDVVFYDLGRRVGIDALNHYTRALGLSQKTGIDLPGESTGSIASRKFKQVYNIDGGQWYPADTVKAAIGQGANNFTPIQIVDMVAALANGGALHQPYLIDRVVSPEGKILLKHSPEVIRKVPLKPTTVQAVSKALQFVMSAPDKKRGQTVSGTGYLSFQGFTVPTAGKTGTAQKTGYQDSALFTAYAPADHPKVAVLVVIDQGVHGGWAAPVARKILSAALKVKPVFPPYSSEPTQAEIAVNDSSLGQAFPATPKGSPAQTPPSGSINPVLPQE